MTKRQGAGRSSADRLLQVLDLFTEAESQWTIEQIMAALGGTRPTIYRYVKALHDTGMLAAASPGSYVLGPRIVQLDRQIQRTDPLLQAALPIVAAETSPVIGAVILCRSYRDQVLAVHVEIRDPDLPLQMERGRSFNIAFGSPTIVILAHHSSYQMKRIFQTHGADIAAAGQGEDWGTFRNAMRDIRRAGFFVGHRANRGVYSVSVPVFHHEGACNASLTYTRRADITTPDDVAQMTELVIAAAARLSEQLQNAVPVPDTDSG